MYIGVNIIPLSEQVLRAVIHKVRLLNLCNIISNFIFAVLLSSSVSLRLSQYVIIVFQ